jgi:peptidyl-prolyl cis-trans isomerase C
MSSTPIHSTPLVAQPRDLPQARRRPASRHRWTERLRSWQHEPLVSFMAIGGLLFLAASVAQNRHAAALHQIVIDPRLEQRLIELERAQNGLTPRSEQLARLVDEYVDDEVRYREALRLGLDHDDEIVRRRLIQKVEFLQHDLASPSAPTDQELRAFFAAHSAAFGVPATVSFEQLYFSADVGGWERARMRAAQAPAQLAEAPSLRARRSSDDFPLTMPEGELSRAQTASIFGDTPIIDTLFGSPLETWSVPVRSGYGWHLVRVTHRTPLQLPAFEQIRAQVEAAWRDEQTQAAARRELEALRAQYQVSRVQ